MKKYIYLLSLAFLSSCSDNITYQDIEKQLQTQLILSQDGDTIRIGEGHFKFNASLTMDARKDIVIKGAGRDKTFLSFKGQQEGAEGIKITNSENISLEDFTIQDTKGDCI